MRIEAIVLSTQHDEFGESDLAMLAQIEKDVAEVLIPRVKASMSERVQSLFKGDHKLHVNPTGKFVIGGPHGDTGLTGRKIIVDTYGGKGAHGGGAFSGKDPSKVDRSAAYATRHIAKNLVAAGVTDEALVETKMSARDAGKCERKGKCKCEKEREGDQSTRLFVCVGGGRAAKRESGRAHIAREALGAQARKRRHTGTRAHTCREQQEWHRESFLRL